MTTLLLGPNNLGWLEQRFRHLNVKDKKSTDVRNIKQLYINYMKKEAKKGERESWSQRLLCIGRFFSSSTRLITCFYERSARRMARERILSDSFFS